MSDKLRTFLWIGYQVRGHHGYKTNHDHLNFATSNEAEAHSDTQQSILQTTSLFFNKITKRFWSKAVYQL